MNATPGPTRAEMLSLTSMGFKVVRLFMGHYFDGMEAVKVVGDSKIVVYVGNAENGDEDSSSFYTPHLYVESVTNPDNYKRIGSFSSVAKAAKAAEFRAMVAARAAIAKATGSAA